MNSQGLLKVVNPKVRCDDKYMEVDYIYSQTIVNKHQSIYQVSEKTTDLTIQTALKPNRLGVMMVGWGGNNGSTLTAALLANRMGLRWNHKTGTKTANWYGSITQASTVHLGSDEEGEDVFVPMSDMLPMVNPDDIIVDGWDISPLNLAESMARAEVLDYELQQKLRSQMEQMTPRPGVYDSEFIAANQSCRATNLIHGSKMMQYTRIREDIKEFKTKHDLEMVIVLWTANTERFCAEIPGVHGTGKDLMMSLKNGHSEISPSIIYAMAAIAENCSYINGSPQNTCVPGLRELASEAGVFIGGDDFKSGQTKLKSVLVDFLVTAGIKPVSIVSYNHLGNNDGKNLSAPMQFRSKEISKSNVVDDMVASNPILYGPGEKPDHCVVIKYVPYVGDSKRAMDEYTSEIMLGGHNTLVVHNTCEDSLLAAPIMLDLIVLTELFSRVLFRPRGSDEPPQPLHTVLSILSYMLKAPIVPDNSPVVNSLFRQRSCIDNVLRACIGLPPLSHMNLHHTLPYCTSFHPTTNGYKQNHVSLK